MLEIYWYFPQYSFFVKLNLHRQEYTSDIAEYVEQVKTDQRLQNESKLITLDLLRTCQQMPFYRAERSLKTGLKNRNLISLLNILVVLSYKHLQGSAGIDYGWSCCMRIFSYFYTRIFSGHE